MKNHLTINGNRTLPVLTVLKFQVMASMREYFLYESDAASLDDGAFVNDNIIGKIDLIIILFKTSDPDFFLNHLLSERSSLTRSQVYIFSTSFYNRLTSPFPTDVLELKDNISKIQHSRVA